MGVLDIRDRQGVYLSSSEENEAKMMLHKVRAGPADMLSRVMEVRQITEPLATAIAAVRRDDKDLEDAQCLRNFSSVESPESRGGRPYLEPAHLHPVIVSRYGERLPLAYLRGYTHGHRAQPSR